MSKQTYSDLINLSGFTKLERLPHKKTLLQPRPTLLKNLAGGGEVSLSERDREGYRQGEENVLLELECFQILAEQNACET